MRIRILSMAVALLAVWAVTVQAAPLRFEDVPAKATWVAHIDGEAMQSSTVMDKTFKSCFKDGKLGKHLDKMSKKCGMDPREDLRGVTCYGLKLAPEHGVMIVRAKFDKDVALKTVRNAPDHGTMQYGDHEIHTWTEKKGKKECKKAGVFYKSNVLVVASGIDLLKEAVDLLDGKGESLEDGEGLLAKKVPQGSIFLVRAKQIDESPAAEKCPLTAQLVDLDYCEGEQGSQWRGHVTITAVNDEVAQRLASVATGLRAMGWIHFKSTPKLQKLLDRVEVGQDGNEARVEFRASVDQVADAMPAVCEKVEECLKKKYKSKYRRMEDYDKAKDMDMDMKKCCPKQDKDHHSKQKKDKE